MSDVKWLAEHEEVAWRRILEFHSRLLARLDCELSEKNGLTMDEYEVLVILSEANGEQVRMAQIAEAALISRSGATRRVDHMASAGLVEKSICLEDRRGVTVKLTPLGWERIRDAAPAHLASVRKYVFDNIAPEELAKFSAHLATFIERLEEAESK